MFEFIVCGCYTSVIRQFKCISIACYPVKGSGQTEKDQTWTVHISTLLHLLCLFVKKIFFNFLLLQAIMRTQAFAHRSFNSPCVILCSHHLTHMHIVRAHIHEHTHGNVLSHLHFIKCLCAYPWTVTPRFCFSCLLAWFFFSLSVAHCGFWLRVICKWHWLNVKSGGQEGSANWNRCFSARRQFGGWRTVRSALTREGRPEKSCDADCNQYFCICLHFVKPDYGKRGKTAGVVGAGGSARMTCHPELSRNHSSFPPPSLLLK